MRERFIFIFCTFYDTKRVRRASRAPFAKPSASRHPLIFSLAERPRDEVRAREEDVIVGDQVVDLVVDVVLRLAELLALLDDGVHGALVKRGHGCRELVPNNLVVVPTRGLNRHHGLERPRERLPRMRGRRRIDVRIDVRVDARGRRAAFARDALEHPGDVELEPSRDPGRVEVGRRGLVVARGSAAASDSSRAPVAPSQSKSPRASVSTPSAPCTTRRGSRMNRASTAWPAKETSTEVTSSDLRRTCSAVTPVRLCSTHIVSDVNRDGGSGCPPQSRSSPRTAT